MSISTKVKDTKAHNYANISKVIQQSQIYRLLFEKRLLEIYIANAKGKKKSLIITHLLGNCLAMPISLNVFWTLYSC